MKRRKITITIDDHQRLEAILNSKMACRFANGADEELRTELNRAQVVPQDEVLEDVVTMNSKVSLLDLDTNEVETYTLVYPDHADIANHMLSVLAPIGTAILGYRVGDKLRWRVPGGWRHLKVEHVVFQPERAGAFHL